MAKLREQLERMVKFTPALRNGVQFSEDHDLLEIDKALNKAIDNTLEVTTSLLIKSSKH